MNISEIKMIDDKTKNILDYESKTAGKMALAILERPVLSAWMILIPILILPFMVRQQRYKASTQIFCEGYLYTKKIALDTVCQLFQNKIPVEDLTAYIKSQVKNRPEANTYVSNIYEKQMAEIELLMAHYGALLVTGKEKYWDMVISHYHTKDRYLTFIKQLTDAEKEVSKAVYTTFKDEKGEANSVIEKMENYLLDLRTRESEFNLS
jgi:hypothetical protein